MYQGKRKEKFCPIWGRGASLTPHPHVRIQGRKCQSGGEGSGVVCWVNQWSTVPPIDGHQQTAGLIDNKAADTPLHFTSPLPSKFELEILWKSHLQCTGWQIHSSVNPYDGRGCWGGTRCTNYGSSRQPMDGGAMLKIDLGQGAPVGQKL